MKSKLVVKGQLDFLSRRMLTITEVVAHVASGW